MVTNPVLATPQESGNNEIIFMALDLASLASVQAFATTFLSSEPRLDILIHNAGERQQILEGAAGGQGQLPPPARPCQWPVEMWEGYPLPPSHRQGH